MDLSPLGPWIIGAAAVQAFARICIIVIALRGTKPAERPEILRALPGLVSIGRSDPPPPTSSGLDSTSTARDP